MNGNRIDSGIDIMTNFVIALIAIPAIVMILPVLALAYMIGYIKEKSEPNT